jgi:DNA-binding MurR/RpiR family transcriptional regulator
MKADEFFERIHHLGRLTPSEAKIAEAMERVYPLLALETITTICRKAKVGRATVVRFIQRLGYATFSQMQHELRSELLQRLQTPHERLQKSKSQVAENERNIFHLHCQMVIDNIIEASSRIPFSKLNDCAQLLARSPGRVYIMGHRSSFSLASFFQFQLDYLRPGVILCDNLAGGLSNKLSWITSEDLLVVFFHSRYSRFSEQVASWFSHHQCKIVVITDRENNPLSPAATYQFAAPSTGIGIFDSRCSSFALLETLLGLVALELEDTLDRRMGKIEQATEQFDIFSDWWKHLSGKARKARPSAGRKGRT